MEIEIEIMMNMDMVNGKVEADDSEGHAAHGSVVGATIRGWPGPSVIVAGFVSARQSSSEHTPHSELPAPLGNT
ncbi:MAG: hypothetical protein ACI3ZF_05645 [Candidatus Cryptobacteroides sp.]